MEKMAEKMAVQDELMGECTVKLTHLTGKGGRKRVRLQP